MGQTPPFARSAPTLTVFVRSDLPNPLAVESIQNDNFASNYIALI